MPESGLTKPVIVNWALVELGLAPNFSVDIESELGAIYDLMWPRTVAETFSLIDWTFCRKTFSLTRRDETPSTGFAYGFDLPGGRLGEPLKLWADPRRRTPLRDKRIEGEEVHCDETTCYAVCRVEVDPAYWDLQFANCFAVLLASNFAVPLQQDMDLMAEKRKQAVGSPSEGGTGGMFGRLIAQNRASDPVGEALYAGDPLTVGRGSSAPWWGR